MRARRIALALAVAIGGLILLSPLASLAGAGRHDPSTAAVSRSEVVRTVASVKPQENGCISCSVAKPCPDPNFQACIPNGNGNGSCCIGFK